MSEYIMQTCRVKVKRDYDLIVAGGGVAGVAAAVAAARHKKKVLIIEKLIGLGGLATNGLVNYYAPYLNSMKDGIRHIGGLGEELLHVAIKYGFRTLPDTWKYGMERGPVNTYYYTAFSPASFIGALDEMMRDEKVDVLFDSVCVDTIFKDGVCSGVIVENKEGRVLYGCRMLVDTTGDVDLMHRVGVPCKEDLNWLSFWATFANLKRLAGAVKKEDIKEAIYTKMFGAHMDGSKNPPGARRYTIESGEEVSAFIMDGRAMFVDYIKNMDVTKEMALNIPTQAQYRTTRRINGNYLCTNADCDHYFEDSIGCAGVDVKSPDLDGQFSVEIPYRTLVSHGYKNMITAGRTIATSQLFRELTRNIAVSAVTGEAAGTACSLALDHGCDINDVPVDELQKLLLQAKAILHYEH